MLSLAAMSFFLPQLGFFFQNKKKQRHSSEAGQNPECLSVNGAQGLFVTAHKIWPYRVFFNERCFS